MHLKQLNSSMALVFLSLQIVRAAGACDLKVGSAWIREAAPGSSVLAAYMTLKNTGAKPLTITTISTDAATHAMIHETITKNQLSEMRMLASPGIAVGESMRLIPGGKHLMLTGIKRLPKAGEHVAIAFADADGCVTNGDFIVRSIMD